MKFIFGLSLVLATCAAFHLQLDDSLFFGRSFIDPIIKEILEKSRPKLANLTIPDINEKINEKVINATVNITKIEVKNLDKFVIRNLKSDLVPLRLTNLTLYWDEINFSALYDVDIKFNPGKHKDDKPINLFGKGKAKAKINNLFFTVGANLEMKNKAIQVKRRGLFGFDVRISKADVSVSSLMNSTDLANVVSKFISRNLPGLVEDLKKPLFDAFHDDIVNIVNKILKNNGTKYSEDEMPSGNGPHQLFDLSEELSEESDESQENDIFN